MKCLNMLLLKEFYFPSRMLTSVWSQQRNQNRFCFLSVLLLQHFESAGEFSNSCWRWCGVRIITEPSFIWLMLSRWEKAELTENTMNKVSAHLLWIIYLDRHNKDVLFLDIPLKSKQAKPKAPQIKSFSYWTYIQSPEL